MPAFGKLEKRLLDLSLASVSDSAEHTVVVGLFTTSPPAAHDGTYGQAGEPAKAAPGTTGYKRSAATFAAQATNPPAQGSAATTSNTNAVTITGLPPGTYTYFGIFGSSTAGQ